LHIKKCFKKDYSTDSSLYFSPATASQDILLELNLLWLMHGTAQEVVPWWFCVYNNFSKRWRHVHKIHYAWAAVMYVEFAFQTPAGANGMLVLKKCTRIFKFWQWLARMVSVPTGQPAFSSNRKLKS